MRHKKTVSSDDRYFGYEDYLHNQKKEVKAVKPKRDIRNWTKAWEEHADEYDELDEFHR